MTLQRMKLSNFESMIRVLNLTMVAVLVLTVNSFAQGVKTIKPTDYIKIEVPQEFYVLSEDEKLLTFPSIRLPIAAVANENKTAVLGINKSNNNWSEDDIEILKLFYKSGIQALHDDVSFLQEEVKEINGKKFIVFEFTSVAKAEENAFKKKKALRNYNYIQYAIVRDDIVIFNFYTHISLMDRYQEGVNKMMNSVVLKKIKG